MLFPSRTESLRSPNKTNTEPLKVKIVKPKNKSSGSSPLKVQKYLKSRINLQKQQANQINIDETAQQIQRELNKSNEESPESSKMSSKPSTSGTAKTGSGDLTEKNINDENVFKIPSASPSPRKQSSRKSKVPTRKSGGNIGNTQVFNSMPVISNFATAGYTSPVGARENSKFTNQNDEKKVIEGWVTSKASVVGESIGKNNALKKYDQFALNTSCFLGKYQIKYYPSCAISRNFCYNNNE